MEYRSRKKVWLPQFLLFLDVDVSTNIDVPNKSTIPTSEWVSSVSKARKSTSQG